MEGWNKGSYYLEEQEEDIRRPVQDRQARSLASSKLSTRHNIFSNTSRTSRTRTRTRTRTFHLSTIPTALPLPFFSTLPRICRILLPYPRQTPRITNPNPIRITNPFNPLRTYLSRINLNRSSLSPTCILDPLLGLSYLPLPSLRYRPIPTSLSLNANSKMWEDQAEEVAHKATLRVWEEDR
jgi:hypothetical protein